MVGAKILRVKMTFLESKKTSFWEALFSRQLRELWSPQNREIRILPLGGLLPIESWLVNTDPWNNGLSYSYSLQKLGDIISCTATKTCNHR